MVHELALSSRTIDCHVWRTRSPCPQSLAQTELDSKNSHQDREGSLKRNGWKVFSERSSAPASQEETDGDQCCHGEIHMSRFVISPECEGTDRQQGCGDGRSLSAQLRHSIKSHQGRNEKSSATDSNQPGDHTNHQAKKYTADCSNRRRKTSLSRVLRSFGWKSVLAL